MGAVSAEIEPSLTARWINLRYFYACEVFARTAYLQRFTPARRIILRIFIYKILPRDAFIGANVTLLLLFCFTAPFIFVSRGLIAILPRGLGFCACL